MTRSRAADLDTLVRALLKRAAQRAMNSVGNGESFEEAAEVFGMQMPPEVPLSEGVEAYIGSERAEAESYVSDLYAEAMPVVSERILSLLNKEVA